MIRDICRDVADMLIAKRRKYGNSALDPVRIFSKADPIEQLRVRIDDKLSRIARGSEDDEDTIMDLVGYLILYKVAYLNDRFLKTIGGDRGGENRAGTTRGL